MPQFLAIPSDVDPSGARALLRGDEAHHLVRVMRTEPGHPVALFDGEGHRWMGRFVHKQAETAEIVGLEPLASNESPLEIVLIQAVPKGNRLEWILEKGTELGVTRFRPVYTARSVVRIPAARVPDKRLRWTKQILSACKQCERGILPPVDAPSELTQLLAELGPPRERDLRWILAERTDPKGQSPRHVRPRAVHLAVGPEGGWTSEEREALAGAGFRPVALGPRVLRTETAAIAGLAVVQARWGDLEGPAGA